MAAMQANLRNNSSSHTSSETTYGLPYPKRHNQRSEFNLPMQNCRYLTLSTTDVRRPITFYSCFAVHRAIKFISPEILSISSLRSGSLLILVKNSTIADKFIEAKELIGICEISCQLQQDMNCVKGIIYAPYLINVSVDEIVEELKSQRVTAVYKYSTMLNGVLKPSGRLLLTFDGPSLPHFINIIWKSVKVTAYIPLPMRCRNCQLLGHTTKHCQKQSACCGCNLPPHEPLGCIRIQCANCQEAHPSSSPTCSKYQEQKEILKIKSWNKCSMREASLVHGRQLQLASTLALARSNSSLDPQPIGSTYFDSYASPSCSSAPYPLTPTSSYTSPERQKPNSRAGRFSSPSDDEMVDSYI